MAYRSIQGNPSSLNLSLFLMALPNFFPKCQGIETDKEEINDTKKEEDAVRDNEILDVTATDANKGAPETLQISEHIKPLSLTPTRVNTLVSLKCHHDQKVISYFSLDFKTMLTKH